MEKFKAIALHWYHTGYAGIKTEVYRTILIQVVPEFSTTVFQDWRINIVNPGCTHI